MVLFGRISSETPEIPDKRDHTVSSLANRARFRGSSGSSVRIGNYADGMAPYPPLQSQFWKHYQN